MIEEFDYKEPTCVLCGDKKSVPVANIIAKLDSYLNKEDYPSAEKLLKYWQAEAEMEGDYRGKLSILNEILGLSRRINSKDWGLQSAEECFRIIENYALEDMVSVGAIYLNAATTLKAFGKANKALNIYKKAEEIMEKNLPKDDSLFGGLYNNFALAYADLGEKDKALELYNKAISIMKTKENGYLDVAISYLNIADLYENIDEEKVAIYLNKAYECMNMSNLVINGYYAFVCRKCAVTFGYYGYFKIKKELNERADKAYERNRTV